MSIRERHEPVADPASVPVPRPSLTDRLLARLPWLAPLLGADALWFALAAILLALRAQSILTPGPYPDPHADTTAASRWYILACAILVIGWAGTQEDVSLLRLPRAAGSGLRALWARPPLRPTLLIAGAVVANLVAIVILWGNWYSWPGALLWLASLLLLAGGYGLLDAVRPHLPASRRPGTRRLLELGAVAAILLFALALRLYRLGDLAPGMHGDEGEVGTQGLAILNGNLAAPLLRGWFSQSNVYYWTLAIFMKVFGTGLFGLRTFALVCGVLAVLWTYLFVREAFGIRPALLAALFLSFQSAALIFSRQEFSNATVPGFEMATSYFLVRGLRTRRYLDFLLAGLIAGFAVYYFAGGRLIAPMVAVFLVYLAVLHRQFLRAYWTRALAFLLGAGLIATPFVALLRAYPIPSTSYPNNRFIWQNHAVLAAQYGTSSWRTILWDQLTSTFSILTHSIDISAMGALDYPIARPLEAVFIVLGLAWAAWRSRDTRFALLSLWFWSSIIFGGVLTTEAPNLPRILGILPVMAILIALMLDRLWQLIAAAFTAFNRRFAPAGMLFGALPIAAITIISGMQNGQLYFGNWLNEHTNTIVTGQAAYVHRYGPSYQYYDMGAPGIYWTHGDNRFINPTAHGEDAVNPSSDLPILDNGPTGEDSANFLVWPYMGQYLTALRAYYPEGQMHRVPLGDPQHKMEPLIGFIVPRAVIDRHRALTVRYVDADGRVVTRRQDAIDAAPPSGLRYPVQVTWQGALVAPQYATYSFNLAAPSGTHVTLDGLSLFPAPANHANLILAQGVQLLRITATLSRPSNRVTLSWSGPLVGSGPIARRFLWDGHLGMAWSGVIRPLPGSIDAGTPIVQDRVDGLLGFRSSGLAFDTLAGAQGQWRSNLTVTRAGTYGFELSSLGNSSLIVDGKRVLNDIAPGPNPGVSDNAIFLKRGVHHLTVNYVWPAGTVGNLELRWQPPGRQQQIMVTPALHAPGPSVWWPGTHPRPPAVVPPAGSTGIFGISPELGDLP